MQSNEAYKKIEEVVLEIDPTAKELADLIVDVIDRNYLEHSLVHFYDAIIDRLTIRVAQIKLRNLNSK
jgi:hypothetical protein